MTFVSCKKKLERKFHEGYYFLYVDGSYTHGSTSYPQKRTFEVQISENTGEKIILRHFYPDVIIIGPGETDTLFMPFSNWVSNSNKEINGTLYRRTLGPEMDSLMYVSSAKMIKNDDRVFTIQGQIRYQEFVDFGDHSAIVDVRGTFIFEKQ